MLVQASVQLSGRPPASAKNMVTVATTDIDKNTRYFHPVSRTVTRQAPYRNRADDFLRDWIP